MLCLHSRIQRFCYRHSDEYPQSGEYALVKPTREMLFVPLSSDEKYKVKNFLDAVVYRGGDALSAQVEGIFANIGIVAVLLVGVGISFV